MHRIKLLVALIILCLALGVKAQDKPKAPRFDLPPNIKAAIADTTALKQNIAALDSLIRDLQAEKKNQSAKLRILWRLTK